MEKVEKELIQLTNLHSSMLNYLVEIDSLRKVKDDFNSQSNWLNNYLFKDLGYDMGTIFNQSIIRTSNEEE